MRTDQLFEQWNTDTSAIMAETIKRIGPCDVFIGGSLADHLGTAGSDVDLYCFRATEAQTSPFPIHTTCGDARLELYIVNVNSAMSGDSSLRSLVTDNPPPAPHRWPLLSPQRFRQMHALYRDCALSAGEASSAARVALAPDLLHIYAGLRAILNAGALAEDLLMHDCAERAPTRLYCARLLAESAIDAALSTQELVNPNPKWRLQLASRAGFTDPRFPETDRLLHALFPDISDAEKAIAQCLAIAADCLHLVVAEGSLRRFPSVGESLELVEAAANGK